MQYLCVRECGRSLYPLEQQLYWRKSGLHVHQPNTTTMGDKFEQTDRFKEGLRIRKEVLGDAYVDKALEGVSLLAGL